MVYVVDPETLRDVNVSLEEAARMYVEMKAERDAMTQAMNVLAGQMLRSLEEREAKEIVVGDFTIQMTETWEPYEWQKGLLEELAKPLLNPEQWQKAVSYVQVPAHEEMQVNTVRMKAALEKKGIVGKEVLRQTMTRKLRNVGVKVERNG